MLKGYGTGPAASGSGASPLLVAKPRGLPFELDHALPPLESQADLLRRIAEALDRLAPPPPDRPDFDSAEAFIWRADTGALAPVARVNRVDIALLRGIDRVRDLRSRTPSASRAPFPPIMRFSGARAAWASRP